MRIFNRECIIITSRSFVGKQSREIRKNLYSTHGFFYKNNLFRKRKRSPAQEIFFKIFAENFLFVIKFKIHVNKLNDF